MICANRSCQEQHVRILRLVLGLTLPVTPTLSRFVERRVGRRGWPTGRGLLRGADVAESYEPCVAHLITLGVAWFDRDGVSVVLIEWIRHRRWTYQITGRCSGSLVKVYAVCCLLLTYYYLLLLFTLPMQLLLFANASVLTPIIIKTIWCTRSNKHWLILELIVRLMYYKTFYTM